jgi:hypothetical protein
VESIDPFNKVVGDYAALLAKVQKASIEKFSDPFSMPTKNENFEEEPPHGEVNKS